MSKSSTDLFWNRRPSEVKDPQQVNINDLVQRRIECDFIGRFLHKDLDVLEVGCGNGFLSTWISEKVNKVDAFDYSANMIKQAKETHSRENIFYFEDNIVEPKNIKRKYDLIVCVRVLINLKDFEEQRKATKNIHSFLKDGGNLVLIEGFIDGFYKLNEMRTKVGLKTFSPASINFYSNLEDYEHVLDTFFTREDSFHTGMYDFLTRLVNPLLNGEENCLDVGTFHEKTLPLSLAYNPEVFSCFARLHGWSLKKI